MKRVTSSHAQVIVSNATGDLPFLLPPRLSMNDAQNSPQTLPEWELPNHQKGLVEDIIEEGQYEAAIEMLFQLRSAQYKPSMQVPFRIPPRSKLKKVALQTTYATADLSRSASGGESFLPS